jgi:hypothetical protein
VLDQRRRVVIAVQANRAGPALPGDAIHGATLAGAAIMKKFGANCQTPMPDSN